MLTASTNKIRHKPEKEWLFRAHCVVTLVYQHDLPTGAVLT